MADTLLHVTLVRELSRRKTLEGARDLLETNWEDFKLGAVIHDLSYYENILKSWLNKVTRRPQTWAAVGQRIHNHGCKALVVDCAARAKSHAQAAIAAGMLAHFATDLVFHEFIEGRVALDPGTFHETIENEIGLHCHYDLLGHGGVWNVYSLENLSVHPEAGWARFFRESLMTVYGKAPPESYLEKCLRSLRLFGYLNSAPHAPWVSGLPKDDPELARVSLDLFERSALLSAELINLFWRARHGEVGMDEFRAGIPDRRLSDGL